MKKLITATDLRRLAETGKEVTVSMQSVLSPSARDLAKELGIQIIRENSAAQLAAGHQGENVESGADKICDDQANADGAAATLKTQVRQVLAELLKPACAQPKLTQVKGSEIVLQPFESAPPGQQVKLKDVITAREANLAAGFMSFDHAKFPWNLTYDEVDYVVAGTFVVESGGKVYTCVAGDVLYIPKDTQVVFGSPDQAKVFYVTYPANWAEL